jgi:hypothetical protein
MSLLRYGNLCNQFFQLAIGLAASEKTKEITERHKKAMEKEMTDLKRVVADALKKEKAGKDPSTSSPHTDTQDSEPMEMDPNIARNRRTRDPPVTSRKALHQKVLAVTGVFSRILTIEAPIADLQPLVMCRGNLETVAMGRLIGGARRW